ncbi:hypothetical protein [Flavobacterium sp. J27]|uniref:hypothetical protein n=1 Tax=Flavobacterium sp. J27 TaxID=2060419 RepID=UPI00102F6FA7|nr:hypothetical protein [Flavobacterium sp. J27]
MKKILLLYYCIWCVPFFSQVRLTDVAIKLKKNTDYHQLVTQVNTQTNEVFSFASDKEHLTGVKFNSALFFSDSISLEKPATFRNLMGCGFTNDKAIAYWATEDLKQFAGIEFDYKTHTTKTILYPLNLKNYTLFSSGNENGMLYFLAEEKESKKLVFITIKGHDIKMNQLQLDTFIIEDNNKNKTTLGALLHTFEITKMHTQLFNSYVDTAHPIKYYLSENRLFISLDHTNDKTQLFEIDLKTFQIKEIVFNKNRIPNITQSNSLLFDNHFALVLLNKEILDIEIYDYTSKKSIKTYQIKANLPSPFTSDLLVQTGNNEPRKLKNTKKFIQKLSDNAIGLSIYPFKGNYLATFGGNKEFIRNSAMLLDIGLQIAGAGGGDLAGSHVNQNTFFDVQFDSNFNIVEMPFEPLYIDKIAQFIAQNKAVNYEYFFSYQDFYILSYYDSKKDEIVLSKFTNGYDY